MFISSLKDADVSVEKKQSTGTVVPAPASLTISFSHCGANAPTFEKNLIILSADQLLVGEAGEF
ncbi:MAG: hypothetical protein AAFR87_01070 [Bacteroidota bacterium]